MSENGDVLGWPGDMFYELTNRSYNDDMDIEWTLPFIGASEYTIASSSVGFVNSTCTYNNEPCSFIRCNRFGHRPCRGIRVGCQCAELSSILVTKLKARMFDPKLMIVYVIGALPLCVAK